MRMLILVITATAALTTLIISNTGNHVSLIEIHDIYIGN